MNIALWIVQGILAALFAYGGSIKAFQAKEKLAVKMPWVNDFSDEMVKFIGTSQLLASIGLIVPMLFGIAPVLTPLAAAGLGVIMILGAIYHFRKKEYSAIALNTVFFVLAAFVAFGRF